MVGSWVAFPLAAILVCLGLGLLVDRAAGRVLRPILIVPVGFAALVCLTQLTTMAGWSAPLTVPAVAVVALAGFIAGRGRLRELGEARWAALAALGAFVITGLPVIATGQPTFAGYTILADTVVHLAGAVQLLESGRDLSGLGTSDYQSLLRAYYVDTAYPSGGAAALGALARSLSIDPAWIFQPYLSLLVGLLALAIAALVEPLVGSLRWQAFIGFVGAQPALLTSFVMQGSMKEVAAAALLTTAAAVVVVAATGQPRHRCAIPLAVTVAACFGVLGPSVAVWVGPLLLGWGVLVLGRRPRRLAAVTTFAVVGLGTIMLALPTVLLLGTSAATASSVATAPGELGNLLVALDLRQAIGVWLAGDHRARPVGLADAATTAMQVLVVVLAVTGFVWSVRRRAWGVAAYAAAIVLGSAVVIALGSAWADGKALAILSPAVMVLALVGVATAIRERSNAASVAVAAVVAGGVLASSALIYWSASVAPYDALRELSAINASRETPSPALVTTQDEFAAYFLRDLRPYRAPVQPGGPDGVPVAGGVADLDGVPMAHLAPFPTVIMHRGPLGSRPSSVYAERGRSREYAVWVRPTSAPGVIAHLPLGSGIRQPSAVPGCPDVRALAEQARRAGGQLVAAHRPEAYVVNPALDGRPARWSPDPSDRQLTLVLGVGAGEAVTRVRHGRFDVWLEGSIGRRTHVAIDGRSVGSARNRLAVRRTAVRLGAITLDTGAHTVRVERAGRDLLPGNGGLFRPLGPVYLVRRADSAVSAVEPRAWRRFCGVSLDWIEAVA